MNRPASRAGFTVTELIIGVVVFAILMSMTLSVFIGMRQSVDGMHRLDIFHDLRSTSRALTDKLAAGNQVLFPPDDGQPHHQLFFLNRINEVTVIFLDPKGQLVMLNCDRARKNEPDALQVLARKSIEFTVVREGDTYLSFKIRILDAKGFEFSLTDGISLKNIIR
ncbi:MAG: type II secretion system protein [Candidatus Riflebacteria bacterium]|nr:type II secretion system protein [Candidatus Riflebacteria bacterium]